MTSRTRPPWSPTAAAPRPPPPPHAHPNWSVARRRLRRRRRRRCCSLVCQHLRHCFIGTHFWYWSLGNPTTKRRQATQAHPSKKAKGVYLIAKELKIHFYEFATCNKTIENDDKSTWSTLVPFSAKKLRKKTQGSRSCKDTVPRKVLDDTSITILLSM